MLRLKRLNQRGDTIVEVMLVLAIVGLAVGISFATADSSLSQVTASSQNTQSTALLQQQIERLRSLVANPSTSPNYIFRTSGYYCVDASDNVIATFTGTNLTNYTIYPAACVSGGYHIAVSYNGTSDPTFTTTAYWDDIQGHGQDSATLTYRMHQ